MGTSWFEVLNYSLWVLVTSCGRERRWVFVRCTFQKLHWPELLRRVMWQLGTPFLLTEWWPRNCCTFERRACFLCTACCNGVDFGKHVIMGWRDPQQGLKNSDLSKPALPRFNCGAKYLWVASLCRHLQGNDFEIIPIQPILWIKCDKLTDQ